MRVEIEVRDIAGGAINEIHARANVPHKPVDSMSDDELGALRAATNAILWENGHVEWIDNPDDQKLTAHQRDAQEELVSTAMPLVAEGIEPDMARELALLSYLIDHPDASITPLGLLMPPTTES